IVIVLDVDVFLPFFSITICNLISSRLYSSGSENSETSSSSLSKSIDLLLILTADLFIFLVILSTSPFFSFFLTNLLFWFAILSSLSLNLWNLLLQAEQKVNENVLL